MKNNNPKITAITVKASNGEGRRENCTIEDLIQVLNALNYPMSIEIKVLERVKQLGYN